MWCLKKKEKKKLWIGVKYSKHAKDILDFFYLRFDASRISIKSIIKYLLFCLILFT